MVEKENDKCNRYEKAKRLEAINTALYFELERLVVTY